MVGLFTDLLFVLFVRQILLKVCLGFNCGLVNLGFTDLGVVFACMLVMLRSVVIVLFRFYSGAVLVVLFY